MPLIWARDATSDIASVKNTLSSWDACMSKTYCKWPVIAAIIIGSLIILSLLYCLGRCICCGAECCCGCLSCCNACCPSRSRNKNSGYQQPSGPPPQPYTPYGQYQSPVPPAYNPGFAYNHGPQTATFDAPSKSMNEDALPAMPSWDNARTRRVEQEHLPQYEGGEDGDIVEMDKFDNRPGTTQQHLLAHDPAHESTLEHGVEGTDQYYHHNDYDNEEDHTGYDYPQNHTDDYDSHNHQASTSPVYDPREQYSGYSQPQAYTSPHAPTFNNYNADPVARGPYASPPPPADNYAQRAGPPSYHTGPPNLLSPGGPAARRPVNGSWRNV